MPGAADEAALARTTVVAAADPCGGVRAAGAGCCALVWRRAYRPDPRPPVHAVAGYAQHHRQSQTTHRPDAVFFRPRQPWVASIARLPPARVAHAGTSGAAFAWARPPGPDRSAAVFRGRGPRDRGRFDFGARRGYGRIDLFRIGRAQCRRRAHVGHSVLPAREGTVPRVRRGAVAAR